MNPIVISASLVLFKPDVPVVERTLLALQEAARFAKRHYALQLTLTLVDNTDDSVLHSELARWFEGFDRTVPDLTLRLVCSPSNVGYGLGNNLVIVHARSDYHIVVNPDVFVEPDGLLEAIRFMEAHRDVGLLSPAVFGLDGERHYLCKRNPTLFIMFVRSWLPRAFRSAFRSAMDAYEMRDCDYDKPIHDLEYPTGCFMFFRTAPLQTIGGFDPDFFLHFEDADIGRRLLKVAGSVYMPTVRVKHLWARDPHRSLRAMLVATRSGWTYLRKWAFQPATERPASQEDTRAVPPRDPAIGSVRPVLVTGANGFVGQAVCADLRSRGDTVRGAVRKVTDIGGPATAQQIEMGNIDEHTDWAGALVGIDSVVHLAARVHLMHDTAADPLAEFRRVNVALTLNLARQAVVAGVRRFVYVSSVKVNGERAPVGQPFTEDDLPRPIDPYGVSKLEAEQGLMQLAKETGLELVIIRPVLVYGPGVKANFKQMMRWMQSGVPLPLGALDNRRSVLALDNLVDFIATCLHHPSAANQTFLISDGEDLTVTELFRRTAAAFGKRAILVPVPTPVLKMLGRMVGKTAVVRRLCDPLQVNIGKARRLLNWTPPLCVDTALRNAARQFRNE